MRLVLDVENTTTTRGGKLHLDPFEETNFLVQVGMMNVDNVNELHLINIDHVEKKDTSGSGAKFVQQVLDNTTLLIMHNAQHDLMWLWECGFKYEGAIYDTMLAEYVLLRGQKDLLSLAACAERRNLNVQKDDTLKRYFKEGYNTNEIPLNELEHYLRCDLLTTGELFHSLERDYNEQDSRGLLTTREVTFRVCRTLTRINISGIRVDREALDLVRKEFEQEKADLEDCLQRDVRSYMGDTPINLNSPLQLSEVVFSRRINDRKEWAELFDRQSGLRDKYGLHQEKVFKNTVAQNSTIIKRTNAFTCPVCKGKGFAYKVRKDGTKYAKPNKCKDCSARGYGLKETNIMAGLGFGAPNVSWISANGFSTGKDNLESLMATAKNKKMDKALTFLTKLKRHSAISSYLSSFVEGIDVFTKKDGFLHASLTQHITATGRFSGRNPNMQNMPRGGTFPVKKVFISRWPGGKICEADFAQLEFRVAAFLSQDKRAMEEIETGFDVHSYTAKVISDAGQPTTRQEGKAHTFAPLFGASGYGRSQAEAAYYTHFNEKYEGIAEWHKQLANDAIRFNKITTPSGRQYAFPDVVRRKNGGVTHFTMIKNYPVQGFSTGCIVPVVLMEMEERLSSLQSCLVNTVHDSTVIDVHPQEEALVLEIISSMNKGLNDLIKKTYNVTMNVPLLLEAKIGPNWLDVVDT